MSSRRQLWMSLDKLTKQIEQHHVSSKNQLEARHVIQTTIVPQIHTIMNDINKQDLINLLGNELLFSKIIIPPTATTISSDQQQQQQQQQRTNRMHFLTLIKTPHTELTAFAIPPDSTLPLHDHPDMTVLFKVLDGKLHKYSANWIDEEGKIDPQNPVKLHQTIQQQKKKGGKVVCSDRCVIDAFSDASSSSSSSTPAMMIESFKNTGGVLHELWSEPDQEVGAIFLDFFTPRYYGPIDRSDSSFVRDCTYFQLFDDNNNNNTSSSSPVAIQDQKIGDVVNCIPMTQEPEVDMHDLFAEMMILKKAAANLEEKKKNKDK